MTFYSTHLAIKAENVLKKKQFSVRLVPVPRHVSSNCGVALAFVGSFENSIIDILETARVEIEGVHNLAP